MKKNKEKKANEIAQPKNNEHSKILEKLDDLANLSEDQAINLGLDIHHQEKNEVWEKWKKENIKDDLPS